MSKKKIGPSMKPRVSKKMRDKPQARSGTRVGVVKNKGKGSKKEITLAETFVKLGNAYRFEGKSKLSYAAYKKAISEDLKLASAHKEMGLLLHSMDRNEESVASFEKGLKLDSDDSLTYYNLGTVYQALQYLGEAEKAYKNAIKVDPKNDQAYNNLGGVYVALGKYEKSLEICRQAVRRNPDSAFNHNNLGVAYKNNFEYIEALESLDRAIELDTEFVGAYYNKGIVLNELGNISGSIAALEKAVSLDPEYAEALSFLLKRQKLVCDWKGVKRTERMLGKLTKKELKSGKDVGELPYINIFRTDDGEENKLVAASRGEQLSRVMQAVGEKFTHNSKLMSAQAGKTKSRKLKIGYMSYDFRTHPLGQQLADLFVHHNRDRVEVRAYSYGPDDGSDLRKRFEENADVFVDVKNMNHYQVAKKIYEDGVDILVDLMGYTKGSRLEILTFKPAPILVNWLGYPGTTGGDFIDYIIGDKIVTPLDEQNNFGESIVQLPQCYSMASIPEAAEVQFKRSDFGLPMSGVVLCSYNASGKIEQSMFEVWVRILKRVPGSVLWLWEKNIDAGRRMKAHAEKMGVSGDRVIMAETLPTNIHMSRLKLADIALDTQIVSGGATTSQALWAGVPVVTMKGGHYLSRMSASMVSAVGMSELVADDMKGYEELVVELASDKKKLENMKEKLKKYIKTAPLFDGKSFVSDLESGYEMMWDRWVGGEKLGSLVVPAKDMESGDIKEKITDVVKLNEQGIDLMKKKKYLWAERVFAGILKRKSDFAEVWNNLGSSLFQQRKFVNALKAFKMAVKLKSDWPEALNNMGGVYGVMGKFEDATICFEKALEIEPEFGGAKKNLDQAKEFLRKKESNFK